MKGFTITHIFTFFAKFLDAYGIMITMFNPTYTEQLSKDNHALLLDISTQHKTHNRSVQRQLLVSTLGKKSQNATKPKCELNHITAFDHLFFLPRLQCLKMPEVTMQKSV